MSRPRASAEVHPLARVEAVLLLLVCLALGWVHRGEIDWVAYGALFVLVDLVGYLPGRLAHARAGGRPLPRIYTALYNGAHSAAALAGVAALWCLAFGPDWTLLALPVHLGIDRGVLGNGFKSSSEPFEAVTA